MEPTMSRTVGILTDPEMQHSAVQTLPVRVSSMRELPHHEARLKAAAESQASVMSRVQAVLHMQRALQTRYQAVAGQVIELREDRAAHVDRAEELQGELITCGTEVEA